MSERWTRLEDAARSRFGEVLGEMREFRGERTWMVEPGSLIELLKWLRDESEPRFSILSDISSVDGLKLGWEPRFRVSYHLLAPLSAERLRVQAAAPDQGEGPVLPTATGLFDSADWDEREVWDLMGIRFEGHPDLRRILLHEDYEHGHPLQKQVPVRGVDDDNR